MFATGLRAASLGAYVYLAFKVLALFLRFSVFCSQPVKTVVSAPSEAWCAFQGERPCPVIFSQPLVSSVAYAAEAPNLVAGVLPDA